MDELTLLQQRVQYLEDQLNRLIGSDRYTIGKTLQLNDGRNIQLGQTTGTKIGTATTQKIGFYGATPVTQQAAPATAAGIIAAMKTWGFFVP